jgi:two-component system, chemotaxis family, sensor kinase CheA
MADDELSQKLFSLFAAEAGDAIQVIIQSCLMLEQKPDSEQQADLLADIMREAHKLKGSARSLGLDDIAALIHSLESVFQKVKSKDVKLENDVFDLIYQTLDGVSGLIAGASPVDISMDVSLERLKMAAEGTRLPKKATVRRLKDENKPATGSITSGDQETIRITVGRLDAIYNLVNEIQVVRLSMERNLAVIRTLLYDAKARIPQSDELLLARARFVDLCRNSEASYRSLSQLLAQLQDIVRQARMLPLATAFAPLPRMARDLARQSGKEVMLHIEGGEIELDRSVLEQIKSPLQHLLYNSIDHGLEMPEQRRTAGKAESGRVTIKASQQGSSILIDIHDDGAGIDLARVKEHALRYGLITDQEAAQLDEQEVIRLLFQPGFSTAGTITAVSGRGIGLDIVRQSIETMQGEIYVENNPGNGVRFLLKVPVSIATSLCLLVQTNGQIFALPARNVIYLTRILPGMVQEQNSHLLLMQPEAQPVPAINLARVLRSECQEVDQTIQGAVYLGSADQPVALLVGELYDVQEFVIKELPAHFAQMPWISGAAISGSGEVILVLNTTDLVRVAGQRSTEKDA